MKYVICQRAAVAHLNLSAAHRLGDDTLVVFSEREIMSCDMLSGTLEERADRLGGMAATLTEVKQLFNH